MKESSARVAQRLVELTRSSVEDLRKSAAKYPEGDSFRSIYSSEAGIFESIQFAFECILLLEDEELQRPYSESLESMIQSAKRGSDHEERPRKVQAASRILGEGRLPSNTG